ncbi:MAG: hypothetical protein ACFE89_05325 [Candidatus Hodarchaeota archaeon]
MPILTGLLLGPLGGVLCGVFVGMSGALWEPFLIPILGNIALGLSTGIPSFYRHKIPKSLWIALCMLLAVVLGGFLPTFSIEVFIAGILPAFAVITASIDAVQAGIWASLALLLQLGVIEPILNPYKNRAPE